jgi:ADP-ribose pyrophosphatase
MSADPSILARTLVRQGRKFDFELVRVVQGAGRTTDREIVRHPGAVVVVPVLVDPRGRSVVLIQNFRFSVGRPLIECCAGTIERPRLRDAGVGASGGESAGFGPGEDPAPCAARELVEETGYRAARLEPLARPGGPGWFLTSPGLSDEQMFPFLATGLTHVGQQLEDDEAIQVLVVPARQAVDMVFDGRIVDAKSMLAILLADRLGHLD